MLPERLWCQLSDLEVLECGTQKFAKVYQTPAKISVFAPEPSVRLMNTSVQRNLQTNSFGLLAV